MRQQVMVPSMKPCVGGRLSRNARAILLSRISDVSIPDREVGDLRAGVIHG